MVYDTLYSEKVEDFSSLVLFPLMGYVYIKSFKNFSLWGSAGTDILQRRK
jgi:hypothetical protein